MIERARHDPFLSAFFARIPREVAASFDDRQLLAIKQAFAERHRGSHFVDLRVSLPLLLGRLYCVLIVGPERRARPRRRRERQAHPLATAANLTVLAGFGALLLAALAGLLYLLKSALGIDLVPGFSLGIWQDLLDQLGFFTR